MPDTIRHVTASAFTDGDASAWTRMFVSYNGPRQSFNGAYDEPWFRRAMENHGLELFTVSSARGKQRLLGIMLVFFDLSPLKPEHGLPGVYVDSTTFGTRLGKVGAFAGEAYL